MRRNYVDSLLYTIDRGLALIGDFDSILRDFQGVRFLPRRFFFYASHEPDLTCAVFP